MTCRYDAEHGYLTRQHWPACNTSGCPGCLPCTHEADGAPVRHCTAREGCTGHLTATQRLTCSRCVRRVLANLRRIGQLAELLPALAAEQGRIEAEAFNLAGPSARPAEVRARRVALMRLVGGLPGEVRDRARAAIPDEDPYHPAAVLGRWDMMLREDYDEPTVLLVTIPRAISYLASRVPVLAQDPEQDFPLFASEVNVCLRHLDAVLQIVRHPEKGAPCPACDAPARPLVKRYSHWCDDEDCTREHDITGLRDTWVCQVDPSHWWTDAAYRMWLYDVRRDGVRYADDGVSAS